MVTARPRFIFAPVAHVVRGKKLRMDEFQFLKLFKTHKLITTLSCQVRDGAKPIES